MAALSSSTTAMSPEPSFFSSSFGPLWPATPYCWSKAYLPTVVGTVFITVDQIHNTTAITTVYETQISKNGSLSIFTPPTTTNDAGTVTQSMEGVAFTYPTGYSAVAASLTWSAILPTIASGTRGSCCFKQATTAFLAPSHLPVVGDVDTIDPDDPYGWYRTLFICPPYDTVFAPAQVSSIYKNKTLSFAYTGCSYTSCGFSITTPAPAIAFEQAVGIFATSMTTLSSLSSSTAISSISVPAIPQTLAAPTPTSTSHSSVVEDFSSTRSTDTQLLPSMIQPVSSNLPAPTISSGLDISSPSPVSRNSQQQPTSIPPITIRSEIVQPDAASNFIIGSQTLPPGASITVSNQIITYPAPVIPTPQLPPITIGSQTITPSASQYIVDGQTLLPGTAITVSGTTIQLAATPSQIIVDTETAVLTTANTGGYIWTGLGATPSTAGPLSSLPAAYQGTSHRSLPRPAALSLALLACMLCI